MWIARGVRKTYYVLRRLLHRLRKWLMERVKIPLSQFLPKSTTRNSVTRSSDALKLLYENMREVDRELGARSDKQVSPQQRSERIHADA